MAFPTVAEFIGCDLPNAIKVLEYDTIGASAVSIATPPGKLPELTNCLHLPQNKTDGWVQSREWTSSTGTGAGNGNIISFWAKFGGKWPVLAANDIPLISIQDSSGGNSHARLYVRYNSITQVKIELEDATDSVVAVSYGSIIDDAWYRFDWYIELDNAGDSKLYCGSGPGRGSLILSATDEDFWTGTAGDVKLFIQGSSGASPNEPADMTDTYISSVVALTGADDETDIPSRAMIVLSEKTTTESAAADCDETGATPGDDLSAGTWDHTGNDSLSDGAYYNTDNDGGAVKLGGPTGNSDVSNQSVLIAVQWRWRYDTVFPVDGDCRGVFGRYDGATYTVATKVLIAALNQTDRVIQQAGGAQAPDLNDEFVQGHLFNGSAAAGKRIYIEQMRSLGLYFHPLGSDVGSYHSLGSQLNVNHSGGDRIDQMISG